MNSHLPKDPKELFFFCEQFGHSDSPLSKEFDPVCYKNAGLYHARPTLLVATVSAPGIRGLRGGITAGRFSHSLWKTARKGIFRQA
jgi:hypothetical protein